MGMHLRAADLRIIADQMDKIETVGLEVDALSVGEHKLMLTREPSDQGPVPVVVGITTGQWSGQGVAYRTGGTTRG